MHRTWGGLFLGEAKTGSVSGSSRGARTGAQRLRARLRARSKLGECTGMGGLGKRWSRRRIKSVAGSRRVLSNNGIECDTHQVANTLPSVDGTRAPGITILWGLV